jgi:branched-chain amino acid transport system ATP-binding protein
VSDTVGHSEGERVTVSKGASKAAQVDAKANLPRKPSERATAKPTGKASTAKPRGGRK